MEPSTGRRIGLKSLFLKLFSDWVTSCYQVTDPVQTALPSPYSQIFVNRDPAMQSSLVDLKAERSVTWARVQCSTWNVLPTWHEIYTLETSPFLFCWSCSQSCSPFPAGTSGRPSEVFVSSESKMFLLGYLWLCFENCVHCLICFKRQPTRIPNAATPARNKNRHMALHVSAARYHRSSSIKTTRKKFPDLKKVWLTGLSARRVQRTKSRGPKGVQLEVGLWRGL